MVTQQAFDLSLYSKGHNLLCGAALGFTLGGIIKDPAGTMVLEWAWLAFEVVAVAIHYSPSDRDVYTA